MAAAAVRELGKVTVLVNNAGVAEYVPAHELTVEQWDRTMEVNLRAPFLLTRALLPAMLGAGEGHIMMNVSVAAIRAFAGCGAYGASKAGLLGFTRVLRAETRGPASGSPPSSPGGPTPPCGTAPTGRRTGG